MGLLQTRNSNVQVHDTCFVIRADRTKPSQLLYMLNVHLQYAYTQHHQHVASRRLLLHPPRRRRPDDLLNDGDAAGGRGRRIPGQLLQQGQ
jgi:hypothetical protein